MAPRRTHTVKRQSSSWNWIFSEELMSTAAFHFWDGQHGTSTKTLDGLWQTFSKSARWWASFSGKHFDLRWRKQCLKAAEMFRQAQQSLSHLSVAITTWVLRQEGLKVAMMCASLLTCRLASMSAFLSTQACVVFVQTRYVHEHVCA